LIRHAALLAFTVGSLSIAMVQFAFGTLLVTPVGFSMLPAAGFLPAMITAVTLSAIAASADKEDCSAIPTEPLPKDNNAVAHPRPVAGWTSQ
jgi:hypothetical protein